MATTEETLAPEITGTPADAAPDQAQDQTHSHEGHDHPAHTHSHAPALNPELVRTINVEAPVEDVDRAYQRTIKRIAKMARIPGFRAGKVPPAMVRSRFAGEVRQEVLEALVNEKFREALEKDHLQPVSQPQVSELQLAEGLPLKFQAAFEVLPAIDIAGYDTLSVEKPETGLTDQEFQAELTNALERHATVEPIEEDREIQDGDWAEIAFTGKMRPLAEVVGEDAPESEPIEGEDILLEVGGSNTLQAFTDALRGRKVGDEMSLEVSYPADFGDARLANQTVDYDVTVKAMKRKTFPERTDDFAKELGNYDSWSDFETKLREYAGGRKHDTLTGQAREKLVEALVERFHFPVPEAFVQNQIDARLERGLRALAQQGMSEADMRQLDFARLREAQRDEAVKEVKASLLLDKIAETEHIEVTQDEVERELLMLSMQSREPLDALRTRLSKDGSLDRIREQMRREKTGTELYSRLAK